MTKSNRRNVCFVTGTRAEYGLMRRTLDAIAAHPLLNLQVIATGMHLDRSRGYSFDQISHPKSGKPAVARWPSSPTPADSAIATGKATAQLAELFRKLQTDIVLVVGDRVEAMAAATAGHLSGLCVAHVHGGDRAQGQVDDSLRHAITKLAHLHFPATKRSAERIIRLGEDRWRVHQVGSPGLDGIKTDAADRSRIRGLLGSTSTRLIGLAALVALHPVSTDPEIEEAKANAMIDALSRSGFAPLVLVHPNNDPGADGIVRAYRQWPTERGRDTFPTRMVDFKNLSRDLWLGLLRDCGVLVGNSSSGIIEAASFGTPVVDIGDRQQGRERGGNVIHCGHGRRQIEIALARIWNLGEPIRLSKENIYGDGKTAGKIAGTLAKVSIDERLIRKLIAY